MTSAPHGRAALVTGGSSGIGLAIAGMLLEEGFDLTIASSNRGRVGAAARELGIADANAVVGDVSVEHDCRRIVSAHQERYGRLDVLVNSAGILCQGSLDVLPVADWDRQFAVNVRGTFLMARLALPLLRASRGLIVNLASIAGKTASPGLGGYGATKAAVSLLTESLNAELAQDGVRAIALCPGFVDTPMASIATSPRDEMIRPADCAEIVRMALRLSPYARVPEIILERAGP